MESKHKTRTPGKEKRGRVGRPVSNPAVDQQSDAGRRDLILEAATQRFAEFGFDATSMRDIASLTGIMPGSIYYHFASKEDLFCAVHQRAIAVICDRIVRAVGNEADPWNRLELASTNYLESLIADDSYAKLIVTEFPRRRANQLRDVLIGHRELFEALFRNYVADLPLAPWVDRSIWRLSLLGAMAWVELWYRPGKDAPATLAKKMIGLLREKTETD